MVRHEPPSRWITGKELRLAFTVVGDQSPDRVALAVASDGADSIRRVELQRDRGYRYNAVLPGEWLTDGELYYSLEIHTGDVMRRWPEGSQPESKGGGWRIRILPREAPAVILDAAHDQVKPWGSEPYGQRVVETAEPGRQALQISVKQFAPPPSAVSFRHEVDDELDPWRDALADRTTLRLRARALEASTTLVEIVLLERDGAAWGTNVPLSTEWQDVRVPLKSLRYFSHWAGLPENRGGENDKLHTSDLVGVSICFGAWLYPDHIAEPHTIEIEYIAVE